MIHTGAVIAAGISQGRSTTFKKDLKVYIKWCLWMVPCELTLIADVYCCLDF